MQPGLALRSARSTAMRMLQSYGREHGSPRHKRALAAAVSSRTGLMASGLAPGAASLSALSTSDITKSSGLIASKILYIIAG